MKNKQLFISALLAFGTITALLLLTSALQVSSYYSVPLMGRTTVWMLMVVIPIVFAGALLIGARRSNLRLSAVRIILFIFLSLIINVLFYGGSSLLIQLIPKKVFGQAAVVMPIGFMYFINMVLYIILFSSLFARSNHWKKTILECFAASIAASGLFYGLMVLADRSGESGPLITVTTVLIIFMGSWQAITGWQLQKLQGRAV